MRLLVTTAFLSPAREGELEKRMAATEAIVGGMAKASRLIADTKFHLDDLVAEQVALLCGDASDGEKRAEEFCQKLMASVHRSVAGRALRLQKMPDLFEEDDLIAV